MPRIMRVVANYAFLQAIFRQGATLAFQCVEGLPEGAEFVGAQVGPASVELHFCHSAFPDTPLGQEYPQCRVRWTPAEAKAESDEAQEAAEGEAEPAESA